MNPGIASVEKGLGGIQLKVDRVYMAYTGKRAEELSDYEFTERSVELLLEILPRQKDSRVARVQSGHYGMWPNGNAVLGTVKGLAGY